MITFKNKKQEIRKKNVSLVFCFLKIINLQTKKYLSLLVFIILEKNLYEFHFLDIKETNFI